MPIKKIQFKNSVNSINIYIYINLLKIKNKTKSFLILNTFLIDNDY